MYTLRINCTAYTYTLRFTAKPSGSIPGFISFFKDLNIYLVVQCTGYTILVFGCTTLFLIIINKITAFKI